MRGAAGCALAAVVLVGVPVWAADDVPAYLDADDPIHVDYDDALDYPYAVPGRLVIDGDLRSGYFNTQVDDRDGSSDDSDEVSLRLRLGGNYSLSDRWRLRARLAATCTDSDCSPSFDTGSTPAAGSTIDDGYVVFDETYLGFQGEQFDFTAGRQQTRSLSRGGVFATALTRLTSPNMSVNWTDGALMRYRGISGWISKFIAQYNDEDGSSTLARAPLDFEDDDSRWSAFYSLESTRRWGPITQRGVDVTWMPSALLVDGYAEGQVEDYWAVVGRLAAEFELAAWAPLLLVAGQAGYAPETPTEQALGIGGGGSSDGWAWHLDASLMNLRPGHSLGISYGVVDPGWLLSVSFRPNEETLVLRYHWRPAPGVQLELQSRWREERDEQLSARRARDTFDYRLRLTWAFNGS